MPMYYSAKENCAKGRYAKKFSQMMILPRDAKRNYDKTFIQTYNVIENHVDEVTDTAIVRVIVSMSLFILKCINSTTLGGLVSNYIISSSKTNFKQTPDYLPIKWHLIQGAVKQIKQIALRWQVEGSSTSVVETNLYVNYKFLCRLNRV